MSTHEDASLFRLKMLRERIQNFQPSKDAQFWEFSKDEILQIVGIDLYRSIRNDDRLWQEWLRRTNYFQSLAGDDNFLEGEKNAREATKKVAGILIKIIKSHPEGEDPKYGDMFFAEIKVDFPVEVDYPLPEKIEPYLKDENYFSIKDQGQFLVAPPYDVGIYHNCNKVMTQHQDVYHFVQRFVDTKLYDEIVRGKEEKENELAAAFQELAQAIEPLELFLLTDAKALHTRSFERVQLAAATFDDTVMGRHTKGFQSLEKDEKRIEEIRKAGIDVCDELAYALLLKIQGIEPKKKFRTENESKSVTVKVEPLRLKVSVPPVTAIAKMGRDTNTHSDDEAAWHVERNHLREIIVNENICIGKTDDGSVPDQIANILFENANSVFSRSNPEQSEFWKKIDDIKNQQKLPRLISDLGFKKNKNGENWKLIFFGTDGVSNDKFRFRNPVTWKHVREDGLLTPDEYSQREEAQD